MAPYLPDRSNVPYYHLFHREKPGVFHKMRQKGLISVIIG